MLSGKSEVANWLDRLSRESWQLELLISGFVLFLLLSGLEPYHGLEAGIDSLSYQSTYFSLLIIPYQLLRIGYYLLIGSLLLHLVYRGLWISCLGLRSVSGDIDYTALRLHPRFTRRLRRRIGTFDEYIERLENICSVLFAVAFLLIFSIISVLTYAAALATVQLSVRALVSGSATTGETFPDQIAVLILLLLGLVYVVDFLSLGWIKRSRFAARWYYPVWRVMSVISAANLVRPIYYNLIDTKFGRRIGFTVVPLLILTATLASVVFVDSPYRPSDPGKSSAVWYRSESYEDSGEPVNRDRPSVATAYPTTGYLPLFLPYIPSSHDASIQTFCPDLEPGRFFGFKVRGAFSMGAIENPAASPDSLLTCMRQLWRIELDGRPLTNAPTRFYHHPERDQYGLLTVVPVHQLEPGEHQLLVDRHRRTGDSLTWYDGRPIYFFTH